MRTTGWKRVSCAAALTITVLMIAACGNIYSRTDFVGMVMNKSETEVLKQVGKPSTVDETSHPGEVIWTYTYETFNLENQNTRDAKTMVIFEHKGAGGALQVARVEFG
jgi:hypothetical protein